MRIDELHIGGFGKWRDRSFSFASGLNLFTAPNEAGKTTLLQALLASLYGMKRDYVRVTRYLEEYDRYLPWDGGPYELTVCYTLDGTAYRLHRRLNKEREQARLYIEPEWEEITVQFREDRRRERPFLERQVGLNRTLFADVAWVRAEPLQAAEHLLPSLTGEEAGDPLVRRILAGLEQDLAVVGKTESGESTLLGRAARQLQAARDTLTQAEEARHSVRHLTRASADWQHQLERLRAEQTRLHAQLEQLRRREEEWQPWWQRSFTTVTAAAVKEWGEAARTETERELHRSVGDRLERLESEQDRIRQQLAASAASQTAAAGEEAGFHYLSFAEVDDEEWQTWLKGWYALTAMDERMGEQKIDTDSQHPADDLERLQADYRTGWRLVRELEQLRETRIRLLTELASRDLRRADPAGTGETSVGEQEAPIRRTRRETASGSGSLWGWLAAVVPAMAVVAASWWLADGWVTAVSGIVSVLWLLAYSWHHTRRKQLQRKTVDQKPEPVRETAQEDSLAVETARVEAEVHVREQQLCTILDAWQAVDWEDFLRRREQLLAQIHRAEHLRRETEERRRLRTRLEAQMLRWGVPPHLPFDQAMALVLREHAEWERRSREEHTRLEQELALERSRAELADRLEKLEQEQQALLASWGEQVRTLLNAIREELARERCALEERTRTVEEEMQRLRERIARARGEIGQRDEVSWAAAQSALEEAIGRFEEVMLRRDALQLARDTLAEALREWQRECTPDVNRLASEAAERITGGRYADVRLHPSERFAIRAASSERRGVLEHDELSRGTRDQLYFAQRIALWRYISAHREPLPLFLDDHFIHYDDERLAQALSYVLELSRDHQVFLFSCQRREREILAPLIRGDGRHRVHELG